MKLVFLMCGHHGSGVAIYKHRNMPCGQLYSGMASTLTVAIMVHSCSSGPCYVKTFEGGGNIIKLDVSKKYAVEKDTQASEAECCA